VNSDFEKGDPMLKLQKLSVISYIYVQQLRCDSIAEFACKASIVLKATGLDLSLFINTLGSRLYNKNAEFIKRKLTSSNVKQIWGRSQDRRNRID
jgi:hypothetical protein